MSNRYYQRGMGQAIADRAGLIHFHSHGGSKSDPTLPSAPSDPDLKSDRRELYAVAQALDADAPIAAGIMTPNGAISVREYRFLQPRDDREARLHAYTSAGGTYSFAEKIRIVGESLRTHQGVPGKPEAMIDLRSFDSSLLLWGKLGQQALAQLRIGIAGLGGVGGILAEHLARVGVGSLVLVDYDLIDEANLNRAQGATIFDARGARPKADLYAELARKSATATGFRADAHIASVVEPDGLTPLLDCDFIFCCADSAFARQVLDHVAYAHLIPVVDGGTTLRGDPKTRVFVAGKSQISVASPGLPCLECQGAYTQAEATDARERAEARRYAQFGVDIADNEPEDLRAPSVIGHNALVAALMQLRLLAIVLGTTPDTRKYTQRYYAERGTMSRVALDSCKVDCTKPAIVGMGNQHWIPTGKDPRLD
ncbi:MAG TPA: ThiF family adenylyltransferase [Myxococcales bacterium]